MHSAILECGSPSVNSSVQVHGNVYKNGATIQLQCVEFPEVTKTAVCQGNGEWSDLTLNCGKMLYLF